MKILFVDPHESSLFSFRKELIDALVRAGHQVILCSQATDKVNNYFGKKVCKIIDVPIDLKDKGILSNLKLKNKYKQIIKQIKPDLILSYKIKPNIYCGFYAKKIPMIANITGLGNLFKKNGLLSNIGVNLYRKSFKNVDYVFFQNEDGYDFFVKNRIRINGYKIVPGSGVNISEYVPSSIKSDGIVRFLFASRAIKEKGFDLLLEAIPLVIDKYKNVHFNFLSAEEDILSCENMRLVLERYKDYVTVLKRADNMSDLYSMNDFLVSPSFYREGISNVLLESLASGRPIITTLDNPGCKEVLIDGVNGLGVFSNDLTSLVNALCLAANMDAKAIESMGLSGREYVAKRFDRNIVIKEYIDTIDSIEQKTHQPKK